MRTLLSIQYLRAAAALAVVVYHVLQWRSGGFEVGRAGVDVFFVISGVIMWRITAGRPIKAAGFLWRRLTRVAPAYWLATLLLAAIAVAWPAFLPKVHPVPGHLLLSLAFVPHLDPAGLPFPLLAPGWTLTYEAGFYLIFAAALAVPERARAVVITCALAALVAAGLLLADPVYILGANPLMLEFAAGVWLGRLSATGALPGRAWGLALIAAGGASFVAMGAAGWRDELWRAVVWGAPAAMIVAGALCLEARGPVALFPPLLALGDASYSLYLFHPIAVAFVAHAVGPRPWFFIPLALAAATGAGLAARTLVEKPLMARLRASTARRPPMPALDRRS